MDLAESQQTGVDLDLEFTFIYQYYMLHSSAGGKARDP